MGSSEGWSQGGGRKHGEEACPCERSFLKLPGSMASLGNRALVFPFFSLFEAEQPRLASDLLCII